MPKTGFQTNVALSQNYILFSEDFNKADSSGVAGWNNTSYPTNIVPNATTGPFGDSNATYIYQTGVWGLIFQYISVNVIGTGVTTHSIYAKANTASSFSLNPYWTGDTEVNVTFTLTGSGSTNNGSVSSIIPVGNGWYRCSVTIPARVGSGANIAFRLWPDTRGANTSNGCYFWGAQVNQGNTIANPQQYNRTTNEPVVVYYPTPVDIGDLLVPKSYFEDNWLWACGYNTQGQLGDNTAVHKSPPVQTTAGGARWMDISAGWQNGYGIKTDQSIWYWGNNGTLTLVSTPTQIAGAATKIYAGGHHVFVINSGGYLYGALYNSAGQLGINSTVNQSGWVNIPGFYITATGGYRHSAAIKIDGTLWTWGDDGYGQLGLNTTGIHRSSPVQVGTSADWKQVTGGTYNTAAIKTNGTLWMWGLNTSGQLGDNTIVNKSSPVQTAVGGTTWKSVNPNFYHTAAIKTDGTLWAWGANTYGPLGINNIAQKLSPVQVGTNNNWKTLSKTPAEQITAAIKTDGTLWICGRNDFGQLGDSTNVHKSSPIQVGTASNWKQVSHCCHGWLASRVL